MKGIPIPDIVWCRENEEIISDEDEYSTTFDSKTGEAVLTLVNPMDVDQSTYLARAVNIHGKSECMAHITFGNILHRILTLNKFKKNYIYKFQRMKNMEKLPSLWNG